MAVSNENTLGMAASNENTLGVAADSGGTQGTAIAVGVTEGLVANGGGTQGGVVRSGDYEWLLENIGAQHPRLFLSEASVAAAKGRALAKEAALYEGIKAQLDALMAQKEGLPVDKMLDASSADDHEYGYRAAEAAFVYLVSGEVKYLDFAKHLLKALPAYYRQRVDSAPSVNWYASSRIHALCAFDWIYPDLSKDERAQIGSGLFDAFEYMLERKGAMDKVPGRNVSDYITGFYGDSSLFWYAGLAFYELGYNDALAEKWLQRGFDDHLKLLNYRKEISADQGGAASAAISYFAVTYPMAEFNFFLTFESATGHDASADWMHPLDGLYYFYWNLLPGKRHFGYGDETHVSNKMLNHNVHHYLTQVIHFYAEKRADAVPMMQFLMQDVQTPQQGSALAPLLRFLLKPLPQAQGEATAIDKPPLQAHPPSMLFKNMGQAFMRSGFGEGDTYASFTTGGILFQHRHYDNNNFVIYKNSFLALDSGTRNPMGQHLSHYYSRSIAHNCILIRMPGETFPSYWGKPAAGETPLPVPNDGGQNNRSPGSSEVIAYGFNEDYVYIAGDVTASYHSDKAAMVVRQFVFILPDVFVVFDKVISKDASFAKTWLLHTATRPQIKGSEFSVAFEDGRLFARTVFPQNAQLSAIGGPGKQFWSDGRNWPLPQTREGKRRERLPLLGQWRVEVSPTTAQEEDYFLNLIEVGDANLDAMVDSVPISEPGLLGVGFSYRGREYRVFFTTGQEHGGRFSISENGVVLRDEPLTTEVRQQSSPFFQQ